MSINDATNLASAAAYSNASSVRKVTKSLSNTLFARTFHQFRRKYYKCYYAKSFDQLPNDDLCDLNPEIVSYYSGPDAGICDLSLAFNRKPKPTNPTVDSTSTTTTATVTSNTQTQANTDEKEIKTNEETTNNKVGEEEIKNNSNETVLTTTSVVEKPTNVTTTTTTTREELPASTKQIAVSECWDSFAKAGINRWTHHHHKSYGIALSLYENNLATNTTVGDPIADTYAILTRRNSSILLLADGVNWGPRSRLAARCAVRASMNFINNHLFFSNTLHQNDPFRQQQQQQHRGFTTHDLFKIMMRSFDAAQEFILRKKGSMTTLCCVVVAKLKESSSGSSIWVACTMSIGDSTAYVFNRERGVFELTYGSRSLESDRDMRNVGGALGHVYGIKPDVSNLNYSLMYIKETDIVFLVSDGISDNLDPVVSQTARRRQDEQANNGDEKENPLEKKPSPSKLNRSASQSHKYTNGKNKSGREHQQQQQQQQPQLDSKMDGLKLTASDDQTVSLSTLPEMSPYERYICSLGHMNEVLLRNKALNDTISAQETCAILIEHVMKVTAEKREMLEKGLLDASRLSSDEERANFQAKLRERVQKMRGKLDHASIVAYEVGSS